jgi:hypothetical protein
MVMVDNISPIAKRATPGSLATASPDSGSPLVAVGAHHAWLQSGSASAWRVACDAEDRAHKVESAARRLVWKSGSAEPGHLCSEGDEPVTHMAAASGASSGTSQPTEPEGERQAAVAVRTLARDPLTVPERARAAVAYNTAADERATSNPRALHVHAGLHAGPLPSPGPGTKPPPGQGRHAALQANASPGVRVRMHDLALGHVGAVLPDWGSPTAGAAPGPIVGPAAGPTPPTLRALRELQDCSQDAEYTAAPQQSGRASAPPSACDSRSGRGMLDDDTVALQAVVLQGDARAALRTPPAQHEKLLPQQLAGTIKRLLGVTGAAQKAGGAGGLISDVGDGHSSSMFAGSVGLLSPQRKAVFPVVQQEAVKFVALALKPEAQWVPDAAATCCQDRACGASFGWLTRRHHCRFCGGVYCGSCADAWVRPAVASAAYAPLGPVALPPAGGSAVLSTGVGGQPNHARAAADACAIMPQRACRGCAAHAKPL